MKIAITGASGFIGAQVAREILRQGHSVVALSRRPVNPPPKEIANAANWDNFQCDLNDTETLGKHLSGCDTVIHLAAAMSGDDQYQQTMDATRSLLSAIDNSGIARLVLVSSISVLDYSNTAHSTTIDEQTPVCNDDASLGDYARMKRDQERLCQRWQEQQDRELIIVRPGLVYDHNDLSEAHAGFLKKGCGLVALHKGTVPLVEVNTAAKHIVAMAGNTLLTNEIFHSVDTPAISQAEYLDQLKRHGQLRYYLPLPWWLYSSMTAAVRQLLDWMKKTEKTPDSLRKNSVAARQKPFSFSSTKLDEYFPQ